MTFYRTYLITTADRDTGRAEAAVKARAEAEAAGRKVLDTLSVHSSSPRFTGAPVTWDVILREEDPRTCACGAWSVDEYGFRCPSCPPEQSAADALLGDCDCHYCSAMRAHLEAGEEPDGPATYEERVAALEAEGLTTSDAQAAADAEALEEGPGSAAWTPAAGWHDVQEAERLELQAAAVARIAYPARTPDPEPARSLAILAEESGPAALALELLGEASEAYEEFAAKWGRVGALVREMNEWQYQRVDAYPGWEGTRDVGAGMDMEAWMQEVLDFLMAGGRTEDERREDGEAGR